jgi:hypothetical protein
MKNLKTMQDYFDEFYPLYYDKKFDDAIKIGEEMVQNHPCYDTYEALSLARKFNGDIEGWKRDDKTAWSFGKDGCI